MDFYLEALDRQKKKKNEKYATCDSLGIYFVSPKNSFHTIHTR